MPKEIKYCIDSLKYNEYYDMQNVFDELYKKSKENFKFTQLMDIILSENNILLAYRNIKTNGRGIIPGTDNQNIKNISKMQLNDVIKQVRYIVRGSKHGYRPKPVRRKEIQKTNGVIRQLGIPCIWDRFIEQCIKQEKSKIVNVRKSAMEFLGFSIKVHRKKKNSKYVVDSHISKIALKDKGEKLANQVKKFCSYQGSNKEAKEVVIYNSMVMGIQNYYRIATNVANDLNGIQMRNYRIMYNRLNTQKGNRLVRQGRPLTDIEKKRYGKSKSLRYIAGTKEPIYPIYYVQFKNPMAFNRKVCYYTSEGRKIIQGKMNINYNIMYQLMNQRIGNSSIEYYDNRISLYSTQSGRCYITGKEFSSVDDIHCHHRKARKNEGTDEVSNLVLVDKDIHKLIHAKKLETIQYYIDLLNIKATELRKINRLRQLLELPIIVKEKKSLTLCYSYKSFSD